ncbi:MAG: DUF4229 domain-containing protein [Rhodococcus sp.]|nr:DUF4229 domain-containing protein [Rhodococcus sp. (in: high G+C Gram-positive bacteria)]
MSEPSEKPSDSNPSDRPASNDSAPARVTKGELARDVVLYSVARLLLVLVIGAIIVGGGRLFDVDVPLLVAAIFAVLIALPLSLLLFSKLRVRVNKGIATFDEQRRADQAELRAKLRGEDGA